jgi:hypothetical protein
MLSLRSLLETVLDAEGPRRFDPTSLRHSLQDFQGVVALIRDANSRGYLVSVKDHHSSRYGLIDMVVVEGVTEEGDDYLAST